ncbi:MAG: phospholipase [Chloroflexi bacterium 54-19]|nr:MAG: phospholipase [Chloroflexi bacterium 54-19]
MQEALLKKLAFSAGAVLCLLVALTVPVFTYAATKSDNRPDTTTTPIQHLVVIFQENVSFDHYFGTYPTAQNKPGETRFQASKDTPSVNGLNEALLNYNPNLSNPQRLGPSQALTCDQDHSYMDEQKAFDHGLMDKFVESVSGGSCPDKTIVMDYFDGNTVTALWNYAQNFAMNDNSYGTTFGPSTPGALNLISGQTHGATPDTLPNSVVNGSVIGDPDPIYDDCSTKKIGMTGKNIGDVLNSKNMTWGWFQGGFRPTSTNNGTAVCGSTHTNIGGATITDYSAHHEPFMYYASTANPHHLPPTSANMIGKTDQANHQYDLTDFWTAVSNNNLPAVSFLKAASYQDGHAGYSDPLDEQTFLVNTINQLEKSPQWKNTAVVIAYDDSDGWYDHQMGTILNQSQSGSDAFTDAGLCGTKAPVLGGYQDRCGYGPRLPLLVISPYARHNSVDHTLTDQSSILRFIEDNWKLGRIGDGSYDVLAGSLVNMFDFSNGSKNERLFLNPKTGQVVPSQGKGHDWDSDNN